VIEAMLVEAARWVDALGEVMWDTGELASDRIAAETAAGQFFVALVDGEAAGAIRFQLEDSLFWPDLSNDNSAFIHRLVVRRRYKGQGVSTALLQWALDHARALGRTYLRLDCDTSRPKLRRVVRRLRLSVSQLPQVGPYYVARYTYPLQASGLRHQDSGLGKS
jgi:GNAT superfamily N-acetyltransferase